MKNLVLLAMVSLLAANSLALVDDFEDPTAPYDPLGNGWTTNKTWSTWGVQAGAGEDGSQGSVWGGSNWYSIQTTDGIAAPVNPGDSVTVSSRFQITSTDTAMEGANKYLWNLGIRSANDGSGDGTEYIFARREDNIIGGATTGDGTPWSLHGWTNINAIGMDAPSTGQTSDWFTQKITVTMAVEGYDLLFEVLDTDDATVLFEKAHSGVELPTLAAAPIWYGKLGIQSLGDAEISGVTMDNFALVPEPLTLSLLGLGALVLRRKK